MTVIHMPNISHGITRIDTMVCEQLLVMPEQPIRFIMNIILQLKALCNMPKGTPGPSHQLITHLAEQVAFGS